MISYLSNGRPLIVASKKATKDIFTNSNWMPCVVLLTVNTLKEASIDFWEEQIKFLLEKGANYFVCVGSFSEDLHDAIDDFLYRYDEEHDSTLGVNTITTYHVNESYGDIIDFFVFATEIKDKKYGCLLAIFGNNTEENNELMEALKKA